MRLIIAGSRDWAPLMSEIDAQFDGFFLVKDDVEEVVSGGAAGADDAGETWAALNGKKLKRFPANWKLHGKVAGKIRNGQMAQYADAALVFWRNQSPGSANMVAHMVHANKHVKVVRPSDLAK